MVPDLVGAHEQPAVLAEALPEAVGGAAGQDVRAARHEQRVTDRLDLASSPAVVLAPLLRPRPERLAVDDRLEGRADLLAPDTEVVQRCDRSHALLQGLDQRVQGVHGRGGISAHQQDDLVARGRDSHADPLVARGPARQPCGHG